LSHFKSADKKYYVTACLLFPYRSAYKLKIGSLKIHFNFFVAIMKFIIFVAFFALVLAEKVRYDDYQVYTVSVENKEQLKALQHLDEHSDAVMWKFQGMETSKN
jgi:hypothetical protein